MPRLIDADALIEFLRPYGHMDEKIPFDVLVTDIDVQPTIEAEPVRHGAVGAAGRYVKRAMLRV